MKTHLYIDCDGVIYNSITPAFKDMERKGIDLNNQIEITNYFKKVDWNKLLTKDNILDNSISKINMLKEGNIFDEIDVLTHVSSFYEAVCKTEILEIELPNINVITLPRLIGKESVVEVFNNVLVDDSLYKIKDWIENGGIGVLFKQDSPKDIIEPFELEGEQDYFIINDLEKLTEVAKLLNHKRKVMIH